MSTHTSAKAGRHYWAFISYCHTDAAFGRRLHRQLENYVLPRRMQGRAIAQGIVPKRLAPVFRDRDELPASTDLSAGVQQALLASRSLVVVCSPASAQSAWVSREVELFRSLHPDRPILAAWIDGEVDEAFPAALRRYGPHGEAIEPLAADFRRQGKDGPRLAILKLIAGILGTGLDELIQRDTQRRLRRAMALATVALMAVLVMGMLTLYAWNAQREAVRQRTAAEGLIEFMLTDLRNTLKGVGRLDAMTEVNVRALRYYEDQDLKQLTVESLERRSRTLHAMGEDDITRGDFAAAQAKFHEALRTTARLMDAAPNEPERIFNHAQSEFWNGYVHYRRKDHAKAKISFSAYKHLADKLLAIAPHSPRYLREAGYAEGNLCSLALEPPLDLAFARLSCANALNHMNEAAKRLGYPREIMMDLANRRAWMADVYKAIGDAKQSYMHRQIQEKILNALIQSDPKNMRLKFIWITIQRSLAWMEADAGQSAAALSRVRNAMVVSKLLVAFDPRNDTWSQQQETLDTDITQISETLKDRKPK